MNHLLIAETILEQVSVLVALIFVALALVAFLQTMILQGKKRIAGGIVTAIIVAFAIGTAIYKPTISRTPDHGFIDFSNRITPKQENTQESGISRYCNLMRSFSNEMAGIKNSIDELSKVSATSELEAEKLASKALSVKERASKFYGRLQRSYKPNDAIAIHKDFIAAAEHLRLAAFAVHAKVSSDDSSFRDLQSEQLKEQLKLAQDKWDETTEALAKLAPEFFNNQQ